MSVCNSGCEDCSYNRACSTSSFSCSDMQSLQLSLTYSMTSFRNFSFVGHSFVIRLRVGHPTCFSHIYRNFPKDYCLGSRKAAIPYSIIKYSWSTKWTSFFLKASQNFPTRVSFPWNSSLGSVYKSFNIVHPTKWNLGLSLASKKIWASLIGSSSPIISSKSTQSLPESVYSSSLALTSLFSVTAAVQHVPCTFLWQF